MKSLMLPAIGALLTLAAASCSREGLVWTESCNFPGATWSAGERIVFTPDTVNLERAKAKRLAYSLRYGMDASVESFPMVVEIDFPESTLPELDTISVRLLPKKERSANNSKLGVFELSDTLPMRMRATPGWEASFKPAGRGVEITGIYSLTIDLIE